VLHLAPRVWIGSRYSLLHLALPVSCVLEVCGAFGGRVLGEDGCASVAKRLQGDVGFLRSQRFEKLRCGSSLRRRYPPILLAAREPLRSKRCTHLMAQDSLTPKRARSRPPAHLSPNHRVDHPVAQVLRICTGHPCWPPPSQQVESEQCRFGNPNRVKLDTACSRRTRGGGIKYVGGGFLHPCPGGTMGSDLRQPDRGRLSPHEVRISRRVHRCGLRAGRKTYRSRGKRSIQMRRVRDQVTNPADALSSTARLTAERPNA
jgi:hypothetical protein